VGKTGQKCAGCSEEQSNILTGIIGRCYDQQRWAKQGKNVLDVLKNRATYSQVWYVDVMTSRGGKKVLNALKNRATYSQVL
jgi:hypothetical protein